MSSEIEKVAAEMRDAVQSGEPMKFRYLSEWADRLEAATPPSSATPGNGDRWDEGEKFRTCKCGQDSVHYVKDCTQPQERAGSDAGAVGTLTVSKFRGHLENTSLDYYGDLPEGTHPLYARPQPASDASGGDVADLIAKYEVRERNFAGLPHNEWATGNHQQIQDFLADLHTLSRTLAESRAELTAWHEMVVAAHANRDALWPNNWPQNVAWIAHCLHTRSVPPVAAQQQEGKP